MSFYTSKNDPDLARDIVSKSTDLYIMENETPADDTGVLDKTTPAATTLTPPTSPAWTPDALIGQIVVIQDDNNDGWEFVITDNDAVSLTVDLTSDVDGNDPSANYTSTSTYNFVLWGAEQFIGYTMESSFNDEEEIKEFKEGVPRVKIRQDLLEKMISLETIIRTPGPGVLKAVNNLDDSNTNATYYVLEGGSDPANRPFYYLIAKNQNVNGKAQQLRMYYCQINSNGARVLGGGDEYEQVPALISINKQPLMAETRDRYRVRIEK